MAPELRKRKSVGEIKKGNGVTSKVVEKTETIAKRKAPEDASPVSLKKQKSTKKTSVAPTPTEAPVKKSKAKKSKPTEETETTLEQETALLAVVESSDESEDEDNVQALALQVDSGDEDAANGDSAFKPGQDVGKAPKVSKLAKKPATGEPGVIYIGRVPHGFYEHEMRQYFSQFGPINKIRLSRNKKTGASKHFAFLEFAEANTAEIVAKTMDNYLLFGHILKCSVIPKEQVHDNLFKGANRRFKSVPWNRMVGKQLEKPQNESAWENRVAKEKSKRTKQAAKLKAIGYEFEAPQLKEVPAPPAIEDMDIVVKAIEAPAEKDDNKTDSAVEVTETVSVVESAANEPEVEVASVSVTTTKAPKTKAAKKAKKAKV